MTWARYTFRISRTYLHVDRNGEVLAAARRKEHEEETLDWLKARGYREPGCTQTISEQTALELVKRFPLRPRR